MQPGTSSLFVKVYHHLLRLYPAEFRAEFGSEMKDVFAAALAEAKEKGFGSTWTLFLRELRDLPSSLWREQRRRRQHQRRLIAMTNDIGQPGYWQPATGPETAVTVLPFVLFSILFTLQALGYGRVAPELSVGWYDISFYWHLSLYLVALVGFGIGWVKGFPRWSLGYLGLALVYAWWLHGAVTRGFALFGYPIDHWGWGSVAALLAVALIATLITRSLSPLADLGKSILLDWSRLSFILYGALSWLTLGVIVDGISLNDPLGLRLQVPCAALFILLGVLPYLHLHSPWQRGLALQGAFNLAWLASIAVGVLVSGQADIAWPLLAIWFMFLLLPGILDRALRQGDVPA